MLLSVGSMMLPSSSNGKLLAASILYTGICFCLQQVAALPTCNLTMQELRHSWVVADTMLPAPSCV